MTLQLGQVGQNIPEANLPQEQTELSFSNQANAISITQSSYINFPDGAQQKILDGARQKITWRNFLPMGAQNR